MDNIPDVAIIGSGHKFIVAAILDEDGNFVKNVVRASDECPEHWDILTSLVREVAPMKTRCMGGGKINVYDDVIALFGESNDFGREPSRGGITAEIMEDSFFEEGTTAKLIQRFTGIPVLVLD